MIKGIAPATGAAVFSVLGGYPVLFRVLAARHPDLSPRRPGGSALAREHRLENLRERMPGASGASGTLPART
jgi:hypothetical protein